MTETMTILIAFTKAAVFVIALTLLATLTVTLITHAKAILSRNRRSYADIKRMRKLDEWERQFDE